MCSLSSLTLEKTAVSIAFEAKRIHSPNVIEPWTVHLVSSTTEFKHSFRNEELIIPKGQSDDKIEFVFTSVYDEDEAHDYNVSVQDRNGRFYTFKLAQKDLFRLYDWLH